MANSINYAEVWRPELIEQLTGGLYTAPFVVPNVKWTGAKTFHFTELSVGGYKDHSRNGGWNRGAVAETDREYTVQHDRDIEFLVDKADIDESGLTARVQNISMAFVNTQQIPEMDSYFFEAVCKEAKGEYKTKTKAADITPATVVPYLKKIFKTGGLRRYKAKGLLIAYVSSHVMDCLELSTDFQRTIPVVGITPAGNSVNTRIASLDGVTLMEMIDDDRFATKFDYTDGCEKHSTAEDLNVVVCAKGKVVTVPKISSIYYFKAGEHTCGDGDLYQNRSMWDTFVLPNGKKIDGVAVDTLDTTI